MRNFSKLGNTASKQPGSNPEAFDDFCQIQIGFELFWYAGFELLQSSGFILAFEYEDC